LFLNNSDTNIRGKRHDCLTRKHILEVFFAVVLPYQKLASEDKCQNNPPKF